MRNYKATFFIESHKDKYEVYEKRGETFFYIKQFDSKEKAQRYIDNKLKESK